MWGLGLFFSVQMTFMFGLQGLLMFAIPNAMGLMLFGVLTQIVAKRHSGGQESLALFFDKFAKPFRLIFYIYQIVALSLTVFALVSYLFIPLELANGASMLIFLCLIVFVVLAAGCLLGEEFSIEKIKFSHAGMGALLVLCVGTILFNLKPFVPEPFQWTSPFQDEWQGARFFGFAIPLVIGLLVGPWLDLQHWQRAIQMHRENTSIRSGYLWGGSIFFLMLLFHGCLAMWVMKASGVSPGIKSSLDTFNYAHDLVARYFIRTFPDGGIMQTTYFAFLCICALTTLDSGYVALKWFLGKNVEKSENMLISLIPKQILGSPIPTFLIVGFITSIGVLGNRFAGLQLEYFMVFYASFFVGYAALAIARCYVPNSQQPLPQIKMFSMACLSIAIFAFGYFKSDTTLLVLGSTLPLIHVAWLVFNADLLRVVTEKAGEVIEAAAEIPALKAIAKTAHVATSSDVVAPQDHHALGGHFEEKWFVYSMIATYQDTNSVGNVYFGMYGLFVGKTRELFFNTAMPDFDLKTTKFYILTRSFEHKFVREAREFDTITVKIRVSDFNRKFCTLEHQIFGTDNELLGKGKQSLLFVSAKDYSLLDIPSEVYTAFMKYL
ncbi:hypothetical protein GCM10023212_17120 [Luteolibacter yonseiensis]